MRRFRQSAVVAVLGLAWASPVPAAVAGAAEAPRCRATDLGDLPGGQDRTVATGINNYGQVVGRSHAQPDPASSGVDRAFVWTPATPNGTSGAMTDLGLLADPALYGAEAAGINDAGQVVGRAWNANYQRVFLWTPQQPNGTAGAMADLNNPVGDYHNHGAAAVNASGQVAGTNYANTVNPQPFLWSPQQPNGSAGALAPIGPPLERATAMNAAGQVVGYAGYDAAAALFTPASPNGSTGTVARLALPAGYFGSTALGMNDAGVVVGSARFDGGPDAAFVWTPDAANGTTGAATLLPRVAAGPASSSANDVNNRGDAVGRSAGLTTYSGEGAVLWPAGGGVVDLNAALDVPLPAGWSLLEAVAINDLGQVVANGAYWDGDPGSRPTFRAFLLTPVPEPAAPLGAAALCGYGMLRRRRGRPPSTSARLVIYSKFETTCGSRRIVRSSAPP